MDTIEKAEKLGGKEYEERLAKKSRRSRLIFQCLVGFLVLSVAFVYGFMSTLSKKLPTAQASFYPPTLAGEGLAERVQLPEGTIYQPIGHDVAINGRKSDVISYFSHRPVKALVDEQIDIWEKQGLLAVGRSGPRKGVVIGLDLGTRERYISAVWVVPPTLRRTTSRGLPVQGMITVSDAQSGVLYKPEENEGVVPGMPLVPGGKGGAVFSSMDAGGRSVTGGYTNPGSVMSNLNFYENALGGEGWVLVDRALHDDRSLPTGHLRFEKEHQEAMLLFTALLNEKDSLGLQEDKTLVTVTTTPRRTGFY